MTSPPMTESTPSEWAIHDEGIRLRAWATDTVHLLTGDARTSLTVGTAETCAIRVADPSGRVAREHATIERRSGRWRIVARGGERLIVDGAERASAELWPGVEISLGGGGLRLIAESLRLIALREALARMLGWRPARREAFDVALRQVRDHDLRRAALVLGGDHDDLDLVPIAEELHRLTLPDRPFVVYNPNRSTTETVEDPVRTLAELPAALEEAGAGTLCLLYGKLKHKELTSIYFRVLPQDCRTHLVLCAGRAETERFSSPPIVIPSLDRRRTELDLLITEYVREAAERLYCAKRITLSAADRAWLRAHACGSLPEIQKAALRLVAVRDAGSINAAAALLGISHVALSKWIELRGFSKPPPRRRPLPSLPPQRQRRTDARTRSPRLERRSLGGSARAVRQRRGGAR